MTITNISRLLSSALCLSLLLFSHSSLSSKDFYKWEDENGVVHYSAHPPKDKPNTKVRTTNIYGDPASEIPQKESKAATQVAEQEASKDPERCAAARKNLETMKNNARIKIKEGDSYRFLGPEEVEKQMKTAREIIKQDC